MLRSSREVSAEASFSAREDICAYQEAFDVDRLCGCRRDGENDIDRNGSSALFFSLYFLPLGIDDGTHLLFPNELAIRWGQKTAAM